MFDGLTSLTRLELHSNELATLPAGVLEPLTSLTTLNLQGNPGAPFAPTADALPDDGTVPDAGGTVTLDGSGGAWGTNVTYGWALTDPASGVMVTFDDDTSATALVTIEALMAGTKLTFTLTVTGRGGTNGIKPATDIAIVTATAPPASDDAKLRGLTVNDGTSDLTLSQAFASGTFVYTASVTNAVDEVTLTATVNHAGASLSAVTLGGIAIADSDFTDGITVPSLVVGDNGIVVTVTAEDMSTQAYTVTVTRAANNAPMASDGSVTTDEDTAHTFAADEFNFADPDGDALASVTVVTLPTAGGLALDGTAVTVDQAVPAAKIRDLVFTPEANANGTGYASFTFRVSDGTDESALAYAMTVNVTAGDDPATGGPTISGTAQVGQILTAVTTDIADVDGLTSPTYGYQWIRVDDDGTSNATDVAGETADAYVPVGADVGKKIKVKVSFTDDAGGDEELTSDAYPSNGTIEAAPNAAPAFTSSATFSAAENQTAAGTVEASDSDAGDSVTGYEIQGGADRSKFSIVETSGVLTFRSAPNFEDATDDDASNTYEVVVRATSGTGARQKTEDQPITVTVTDVEGEAPGVPGAPTVSSASVSSLTAAWAAPANAGPPITDYDYRYQVKSTPGWTEVTNTTITALSATIAGLAEDTKYEVQVLATNDEGTSGWSDSGSASTDANAAPAFTSSATFSAAENQTAAGTVEASDSDAGDSVTGYEIQGGADRSKFSIVETSGVLTFRSAPNFEDATDDDASNTYVVVVRATSGTGAREKTEDQPITVTVTDVEGEAPGVPGAPTVSSASVSSLTAAWAAPANAGPPITDYDYRYQVKSTPGWTEVTNTTITALSATITGLAEDTEYEVQVRATNDEGTSGWSDSGSASTATTPGVTVSKTALTVTEDDTAGDSYTVVLDSRPTADVTVTVAGHSGTAVTPDPTTLTFTASNWDTAQTVTVTAGDDADTANHLISLTHSATSTDGGYSSIAIAGVTVTVNDNDTAQVTGVGVVPGNAQLVVTWTAVDNATGYKVQWMSSGQGYNIGDRQATVTPGSTTRYTIPSLTNGTEYTVLVIATRTGATDGPPSAEVTGRPRVPDLAQVMGVGVVPGNAQLVVTWTAVDNATGYKVQWMSSGQGYNIGDRQATVTTGSTTRYTIPSLTNGTEYTVRVIATRTGATDGPPSDEMTGTPRVPPPPVTDLKQVMGVGVVPGNAQLVVTWTAVSTATGYTVQWTSGGQGYNIGDRQATVTSGSTTRYTIPSLTNGTEYTVRVIATRTGATDGPPSAEVKGTPFTTPGAPQHLSGVPGDEQVMLTWDAPSSDGGSAILRYEYAIDDSGTWIDAGLDLEETVPGLTNGREYAFEVRAVNSAGPGAPARTAATPLGMPSVPESLTATGGDGEVVLEWTEPADDGGSPVTGYEYRYAAGQAVPEDVTWRDAGTELTATVSGLENETRYTFEVRARNRVGPGETSGTTALPLRLRAELFSSAAAEGEALVVGVRRSGRLAFPAHAYIGVTDSALPGVTATEEGRDDGLGRHRLEFAAGAAEATVTVTVAFDGERRQDRVLSATLDSAELEVDGVRRPYELVTPTLVVPVTEGDAGLSVADARVQGKSSVLAFTVSMDRTRDVAVRVDYATEDGSARAGEDYTPVSGTLTIEAGGRERTVEVPVLPALHVTGERTLVLRLSNAVSAVIDDGVASGVIVRESELPKAWLARFGRTASDHAAQAIARRLEAGQRETQVTVAGRRVDGLSVDGLLLGVLPSGGWRPASAVEDMATRLAAPALAASRAPFGGVDADPGTPGLRAGTWGGAPGALDRESSVDAGQTLRRAVLPDFGYRLPGAEEALLGTSFYVGRARSAAVKSRVVCKSERKLLDASVRLPWRPPSVREA